MPGLSRADDSLLGRWWWTVDRWTLGAICVLIGFGYIMMLAASPAVAERIGQSRDLFILKQVVFLALAAATVVGVSLLSPRDIRRLAIAGCIIALGLTAATLVVGMEIKGARRWISLPGMSVQPSEFLKPCFAVTAAWLIQQGRRSSRFPGMAIACSIFLLILLLLKSQPDIGMLAVVTVVFLAQLYVAGMNLFLVALALGMIGGGSVMAYFLFPHVQSRVERFLHPQSGDSYQITTALEAFGNGGLLICLVILLVFAFIVLRGLLRLLKEQDLFIVLSCTGLVTGFGLQAFVNMASTLKLIPTKGMTLPFISYGGSSVMAVALGMGMLLALTRRRHREDAA
jgi:cell division protein FtsW